MGTIEQRNEGNNMKNDIKGNGDMNIHNELKDDIAYQYSLDNNDAFNMQLVLRAYGFPCDWDSAEKQILIGRAAA